MVDEQQLASLVLLLRLPYNGDSSEPINDENIIGGESFIVSNTPTTSLQNALERNNCKLLCFLGRLIRQYTQSKDMLDTMSAEYVYLRLAVRVAFLRYVSLISSENDDDDSCNNNIKSVWEYENCLLSFIIETLRKRSCCETEEVDVEMAWVVQSLVVKLSNQQIQCMNDNNEGVQQSKSISQAWSGTIDILIARRKEGTSTTATIKNGDFIPQNDEQLMIKTIHAILEDADADDSNTSSDDNDWCMQYDISLISCLQSYIQIYSDGTTPIQLWTQPTLLKMILWSQGKHVHSTDVFMLVLQYLHICTLCNNGNQPSLPQSLGRFYSVCISQDSKKSCSIEEFVNAIRSFLFYGLVVLSNVSSTRNSTTSMRGDIYSLMLKLWQLCGSDWIFISHPSSSTSTPKTSDFWWFQEGKDNEHRLGTTWPLCTLISMAAGDFRLGLGRWITVQDSNTKEYEGLVSETHWCARIVIEAVTLMTTIAEDEEDALATTWTPDAILHIRKSLEDALNSSVQYFNTLYDHIQPGQSGAITLSKEQDDIGRTCCLVMGTIAAELEVDHLLAPPSTGSEKSLAQEEEEEEREQNMSSFGHALRGAILFCHVVGENQSDEFQDDPLVYLLPCIMSLVSNSSAYDGESKSSVEVALQFALDGLKDNDCFVGAILKYLRRISSVGTKGHDLDSTISTVKFCGIIINEFTAKAPPSKTAHLAMDEVSRCLSMLEANGRM